MKSRRDFFAGSLRSLAIIAAFAAPALASAITINTSGVAVTENFDGMGSAAAAALPSGFKVGAGAAPTYAGGTTSTVAAAGTTGTGAITSSSGGNYYNFANGITASSTERAPGILNSGGFTSPRSIMVEVLNSTGSTITDLDIAWNYEKYRSGTRAFNWTFFVSTDGSTWVANTAGDQTNTADLANTTIYNPPESAAKSVNITSLSIPAGSSYYLLWQLTGVGGSSNGQARAIDDFSITATAAPAADDPNITVQPSLDLGSILKTGTTSQDLTINNTGTSAALDVTSANFTSGDTAVFSVGTLPTGIAAGGSGVLPVTFDPAGNAGSYSAVLTILSTDSSNDVTTVSVTAEALNPPTWVLNEILADPDATNGDANNDGVVNTAADEFVEFVNIDSVAQDISGWQVFDGVSSRHTFPAGTVVPAGGAVIVFGAGTPTGLFGNSVVQVASTGQLGLNNAGDTVRLFNGTADEVNVVYGSDAGDNQSLTLDPDITGGSYVKHSLATGAAGALFSAGTKIDGTWFIPNDLPVADPDTINVVESVPYSDILTASDSDGFITSYTIVLQPAKGTLTAFDQNTGDYTYLADEQTSSTTDLFIFTAKDNLGFESTTATITINISADNDTPSIAGTPSATILSGSIGVALTNGDFGIVDPDTDPANVTINVTTPPSNGQISVAAKRTKGTPSSFTQQEVIDGKVSYEYTASTSEATTDSFSFSVTDGNSSANGTFTINIPAGTTVDGWMMLND